MQCLPRLFLYLFSRLVNPPLVPPALHHLRLNLYIQHLILYRYALLRHRNDHHDHRPRPLVQYPLLSIQRPRTLQHHSPICQFILLLYPTLPRIFLLRFRLHQVLLISIQTFRTSFLTWAQTRSHGYEHRRTRIPSPSTRNQSCPRSNRSLYLFRLTLRPLVILRLLVKRAVVPV